MRPQWRRGMGGHHRSLGASSEWYTPPEVFQALGLRFDLDPCAPPLPLADWIPAAARISLPADGLLAEWAGRVWCNPPYGPQTAHWLRRMAVHGNGVALCFARTDTAWWHEVIRHASAVCFIRGRLNFVPADPHHVARNRTNSNAGAPSCLIAFGPDCAIPVAGSGLGVTFAVDAAGGALIQGSLFA